MLLERNWLVHNFNLEHEENLYDPTGYLYNTEIHKFNYNLIVDLNIYQYLLNIAKKQSPHANYRAAASLLVFCQITDIDIDPTFAVYEKFNYDNRNLAEALIDLELFHNINNGETENLAKYALGYSDSISIAMTHKLDHEITKKELTKYKKLSEWESLYLMVLSIINIYNDHTIPRREKHKAFCDWMIYEFRRSLVAFIYSLVFFGSRPIKKMMKYKISQTPEEKRKAANNMTWDLYIMTQFFQKWIKKQGNEELLYASDDSAFCALLRHAIQVQLKGSLDPVKNFMNQSEIESSQRLLDETLNIPGRAYQSKQWGFNYRSELIRKYEQKIFG